MRSYCKSYGLFSISNRFFLAGNTINIEYGTDAMRNTQQSKLRHSLRLIIHSPEYSTASLQSPYGSGVGFTLLGECTISSQLMPQLSLVGYSSIYALATQYMYYYSKSQIFLYSINRKKYLCLQSLASN